MTGDLNMVPVETGGILWQIEAFDEESSSGRQRSTLVSVEYRCARDEGDKCIGRISVPSVSMTVTRENVMWLSLSIRIHLDNRSNSGDTHGCWNVLVRNNRHFVW
jgi:hypothetical protein